MDMKEDCRVGGGICYNDRWKGIEWACAEDYAMVWEDGGEEGCFGIALEGKGWG